MLINNKYNLGDEVYYIDVDERRITKVKIITLHFDFRGVRYDVDTNSDTLMGRFDYVKEELIWKSIEECKQYIIDNIEDIFNFK